MAQNRDILSREGLGRRQNFARSLLLKPINMSFLCLFARQSAADNKGIKNFVAVLSPESLYKLLFLSDVPTI